MVHNTERVAYRVRDLSQLLGCSEIAARRMVERGEVPSRRLGRRIFILSDELTAWLKALPPGGVLVQERK